MTKISVHVLFARNLHFLCVRGKLPTSTGLKSARISFADGRIISETSTFLPLGGTPDKEDAVQFSIGKMLSSPPDSLILDVLYNDGSVFTENIANIVITESLSIRASGKDLDGEVIDDGKLAKQFIDILISSDYTTPS